MLCFLTKGQRLIRARQAQARHPGHRQPETRVLPPADSGKEPGILPFLLVLPSYAKVIPPVRMDVTAIGEKRRQRAVQRVEIA